MSEDLKVGLVVGIGLALIAVGIWGLVKDARKRRADRRRIDAKIRMEEVQAGQLRDSKISRTFERTERIEEDVNTALVLLAQIRDDKDAVKEPGPDVQ